MEYKLTSKCQINKRGKDNKSNSYLIYFLNGVQILKQKVPFDENYEPGFQHRTGIDNEYLFNGRLYQTREKFGKIRMVSFPVSLNKLNELGFPNDLKLNKI